MCTPASFVLTKDSIFWSKISNSHEDIIEENKLCADGARGPNILRVEISPQDADYTLPLKSWKYHTDQDILPVWANVENDEKRTRLALKTWKKYHCCSQKGQNLVGGFRVNQVGSKNTTQKAGSDSTQTVGNNSTQTAGFNSTQTAGSDSTQKAGSYSTQTADDYSTQKAGSDSTQKAGSDSTQTANSNSTQKAGFNATQKADDYSTQKAGSYSTQKAGNHSYQKAGLNTVQITQWHNQVDSRIIDVNTANQWFYVENGQWRLCTEKEISKLNNKIS